MAVTKYRIVSGEESEIHQEPHIQGSRVTVRQIHSQVEERGLGPETVATRHGLDIGAVYEALAYYHRNPKEMRDVQERHERAAKLAAERSSIHPGQE